MPQAAAFPRYKSFRQPFSKGCWGFRGAKPLLIAHRNGRNPYTSKTQEEVRKLSGGQFSRGNPRLGFPLIKPPECTIVQWREHLPFLLPISPLGETEESGIRMKAVPFFSCKKGTLEKHPTGIFFNSPPKMRPPAKGSRPLRRTAKGALPLWKPRRLLVKVGRKL